MLYSIKVNIAIINVMDSPIEGYEVHWFYGFNDEINFLGSRLHLSIDIGDFDKDGQTEWIFQYSGYNNDGYTLFYNFFKKPRFEFNWVVSLNLWEYPKFCVTTFTLMSYGLL